MADRVLAWLLWACTAGMAILGLATVPRLALRALRRWNRDLLDVVDARRQRAQLLEDNNLWRRYALQLEAKLKKLEEKLASRCPHGHAFNACPRGCRV